MKNADFAVCASTSMEVLILEKLSSLTLSQNPPNDI